MNRKQFEAFVNLTLSSMAKYGIESLRIGSIPWVYLVEWTSTGHLTGASGGYFDAVAKSLNISYTVSMPADLQWGSCSPDASTCSGMLGDLLYNRSDVGVGPFTALPVYSELFHQSFPNGYFTFSILTGMKIAYAVNTFSTFTGIEGIVYGLLLLLPLAITVLVALNSRYVLPKLGQSDDQRMSVLFLDLLRLNTQNPSDIRVQSSSNRLLVAGCMLAALLTAIMVSSSIKATMMRRDPTERINTVADLLKRQHKMSPIMAPNTFVTDFIGAEKSGEMHEINQWIERTGYVRVDQILSVESIRGVLNGTKFLFIDCGTIEIYLAQPYFGLPEKHRGYFKCMEQVIFSAPTVWYYRRGLPDAFIHEFNKRIIWIIEAPTRFVFNFKYTHVPPDRFARNTAISGDAVIQALKVDEVIGSFYLIIAGTGGALLILILELLISLVQPSMTGVTIS